MKAGMNIKEKQMIYDTKKRIITQIIIRCPRNTDCNIIKQAADQGLWMAEY